MFKKLAIELTTDYWFKDDCKNPDEISVKEAYELGFNRAFELFTSNCKSNVDTDISKTEKKWRPYTLNEFVKTHNFGKTIIYRYNGTYCDDHREAEVMYLGYVKPLDGVTDVAGKGELVLGNESLGLQNLFNNYEMWVDGEWQPFGVLDDGDKE